MSPCQKLPIVGPAVAVGESSTHDAEVVSLGSKRCALLSTLHRPGNHLAVGLTVVII